MLKTLFLVGCGSFIGGVLRYLMSCIVTKVCDSSFPWGTLSVNMLGCFLIGLLHGYFSRDSVFAANYGIFLTAGLCGGLTTFSTFAHESLKLLQSGNILGFGGYTAVSLIVGISMVSLGYCLSR